MDRQVVYVGQIPQDTDLLLTNKNIMIGLGYALQAILGTSTLVDGLACTPTGPATLSVNVGNGSIYSLAQVDATAYGSISADTTDQIVKQGINLSTQNFSTPAPATTGQSVVYLIEAAYQDYDTGATVLPYYNASNPSVAYSGPNNTGVSQNTIRQALCKLQIKTGVAATTGTQTTPSPDTGFTGLFAITVANGQASVTSTNISQLSTAPFITPKLPGFLAALQAGSANFAHDTSSSANTITISLTHAVASLTDGMRAYVKVANSVTGATVMNTNGLGNVSVTSAGAALGANSLVANGIYEFVYDANGTCWQLQNTIAAASNLFTGGTTTGSANAQVLASLSPASGFSLSNNGQTIVCTAGYSNAGPATIAVTTPSISATAIKKDSGSGLVALTGGEIVAGNTIALTVNTTGSCLVLEAGLPATLFLQAASNLSDVGNTATARSNLSAAASGANTDITSLSSPAIAAATATTQTTTDSSTKVATTAFVQANKIITPLGVGATVLGMHTSGSVAVGGTVAGSTITAVNTSGASTGDTLSGTWQALQTYGGSGTIMWQRTV